MAQLAKRRTLKFEFGSLKYTNWVEINEIENTYDILNFASGFLIFILNPISYHA